MIIVTLERGQPARFYEGEVIERDPETQTVSWRGSHIEDTEALSLWFKDADLKTAMINWLVDELNHTQNMAHLRSGRARIQRRKIMQLENKVRNLETDVERLEKEREENG